MAYIASDLRRIDGVPGQQMFLYKTNDALAAVAASGYFDAAVVDYNLDTGDIVQVVYDMDGTIGHTIYVATNTSGTVTVTKTDVA